MALGVLIIVQEWQATIIAGLGAAALFFIRREFAQMFKHLTEQTAEQPNDIIDFALQDERIILTTRQGTSEHLPLNQLQAVLAFVNGTHEPEVGLIGEWGIRTLRGATLNAMLKADIAAQSHGLFALFNRLPYFKHTELIKALSGSEQGLFVCWQADAPEM